MKLCDKKYTDALYVLLMDIDKYLGYGSSHCILEINKKDIRKSEIWQKGKLFPYGYEDGKVVYYPDSVSEGLKSDLEGWKEFKFVKIIKINIFEHIVKIGYKSGIFAPEQTFIFIVKSMCEEFIRNNNEHHLTTFRCIGVIERKGPIKKWFNGIKRYFKSNKENKDS